MKKFFILLCSILLCSGCSVTLQNAILGHDFAKDNIDKRLKEEDYRFVRMVTGEASASYVLWIGGLSERAKNIFSYSYQDMVKKANLKPNQAIINVTAEKRVNLFFYPFFAKQVVHTTGAIVEFGEQKEVVSVTAKPVEIAKPIVEKEKTYKLGDLYVNGDKKGIVISVTEDGKHGKIISLNQGKDIRWSITQERLGCDNYDDGKSNCQFIVNLKNYPAMGWCINKGWYLPSSNEMQIIYKHLDLINTSLKKNGGDKISPFTQYWTSTEKDSRQAIAVQSTYYSFTDKTSVLRVVAMSDF